jgi:hypothetical protein
VTAKQDFITTADVVYSIFRDCRRAFDLSLAKLKADQEFMLKDFASKGQEWSTEDLDKKTYHYAVRDEKKGSIRSVAAITQGEWKLKISPDGTNLRIIGNMCLVMIYQYWEDRYREEIAVSKGVTKEELSSDLFGDIRYLRNSIVHNNGRAISEVDRCKLLKWFKEGEEIVIDVEKMDYLIELIKSEVSTL